MGYISLLCIEMLNFGAGGVESKKGCFIAFKKDISHRKERRVTYNYF